MFDLHEDKLLEALADEENDLFAFDPMKVDADELHSFIDVAEDQGVIGRADSEASITIYPLALGHPEPLVAVETKWSIVVGGGVVFETGLNDQEGTVKTVRGIVEAADMLYVAKTKDNIELDRLAAMLNEYADEGKEWDQTKICNELVKGLLETGRTVRLTDD
ncbi:MAG TPA: hypothetical protein VJQ84_05855 [Solirubrobacterales bacterium]|nr:hypothetical protein [Solirubrobacterales bacterium]